MRTRPPGPHPLKLRQPSLASGGAAGQRPGSWLRALVMTVLMRMWSAPFCACPWMLGALLPAMSAATRERKLKGWARAVKGVLASDEGEG